VAISATTPQALENTCQHFLKKLNTDTYNIEDLSHTSVLKRDHYKYRLAFAAKSTPDLEQQISSKMGNLEAELRVSLVADIATIKYGRLLFSALLSLFICFMIA
jgi:acyl transferase domain-containing protein